MLLDRLELNGFKSFANRTQIRFSTGVTCVVGPNGCGKSNIADAVRWALGEQNVRSLRGKSLVDVIFKGTREVRPAGMAEVVLHLDNQEQRLATEYQQVAIQRRAFRSGESEFRINKAACRLKDIRSLFMDTGLGSSQYAVIEREMIDEVLSDRDDARRFLIDETSGITRYKQRRKETLRKIKAVEDDLTRVEDVLEIEERQIRSLAYQVGKARRYQRLSERMQTLDVALARLRWQALEEEASGESHRLAGIEKERSCLGVALHEQEARQENLRLELLETNRALSSAREKLQASDSELASNREETLVRKERLRFLNERTADLTQRIRRDQEARDRGAEELAALLPQFEALSAESDAKRRMSAEVEKEWSRADVELKRARKELVQHQQIHIEQVRRRSEADQRIRDFQNRLSDLEMREEKYRAQIEALGSRTETLNVEISQIEERRDQLELQQQQKQRQTETLNEQHREAEDRIHGLSEEIGQLADEIARLESRRHLLEEQARTYEGFREGVAQLLAHREEVPGVLDVATELLVVDPAWADRLTPALREQAEWVVTECEQDAWGAIEWLRARGLGCVTFVPLRELAATLESDSGAGDSQHASPIGLPDTAVTPRRPEAAALAAYIRRAYIPVEDPSEIQPVSDRSPGKRWVTQSGEVATSEGCISAGGGDAPEERLWSRPQEIELLTKQLEELTGKRAELDEERGEAQERCDQLLELASAMNQERDEQASQIENLARTLLQKQAEYRLLKEEMDRLQSESCQLEERRQEMVQGLEGSEEDRDRVQQEEDSADAQFQDAQQSVEQIGTEKDRLGQRLSEKKMEVLWSEAQLKDLQGRLDQRQTDIRAAVERFEAASSELQEAQREITETRARIDQLLQAEGDLIEQREVRSVEVERLSQEHSRHEDTLAAIEKVLREKHRELSDIEESLRHDEVRFAHFESEKQRLIDRIEEQHGVDLTTLPPLQPAAAGSLERGGDAQGAGGDPLQGMTEEEAGEKLEALRRDRDRLGPVNQLAIEEYASKREHVHFVKSQRDDLLQSRESLLAAIERINSEARSLFEDTFGKVRENFSTTFETLFPGGEAQLRLVGDDPLEADIEIMARPRGKRLESIQLLSSGERALTATALLFSLYLVKPSPFCVLDEVDAPLDDANIDRFLALLRAFSNKTQFIVITHNKRTMEMADTLYGVTMQEPGISRIVSVRLEGSELITNDPDGREEALPKMSTS
ncbi:MAG: chromosome segregation protein SMC [Candidatus Eisenbacteria sp.]|nr:chromosome segregation protein SMC [Candidatus Eisenbacteria bacterium]